MLIDIFYKSYRNDFKWLYYSLKSIEKYITGYNRIVIVIPESDKHLLDYSLLPKDNFDVFIEPEYGNGYLYQQWIKMSAYKYCKADYIVFADSDLIFDKHTYLHDLIVDGQPEILYTDYLKVGDAVCWKEPTENFMNEPQKYEFMRRLPLVYHRSTLENIHLLVPDLEKIIMRSDRFSEFNAIGAWSFKNENDKYRFVNTDNWTYEHPIGKQFWSHSGLSAVELLEINTILNVN